MNDTRPRASATITDYATCAADYNAERCHSAALICFLEGTLSRTPRDQPILSLGCGTGHVEAELGMKNRVVGVDCSAAMLAMAADHVSETVVADMTDLPFESGTFGGAYWVQSLHHVGHNPRTTEADRAALRRRALAEGIRVCRGGSPLVVVHTSARQLDCVWYYDYFREIRSRILDLHSGTEDITRIMGDLGCHDLSVNMVDDIVHKRFFEPEAPLDPVFRRSISDFTLLNESEVAQGCERLISAIGTGKVHESIDACCARYEGMGGSACVVTATVGPEDSGHG